MAEPAENPGQRNWIEREYELIKKPKGFDTVNFAQDLDNIRFTIPDNHRDRAFTHYLREAIAREKHGGGSYADLDTAAKKFVSLQASSVEYQIYRTKKLGVGRLLPRDVFDIRKGVIYITRASAGRTHTAHSQYGVPLIEGVNVDPNVIEVRADRDVVVERTRRQWQSLLRQEGKKIVSAEEQGGVVNFLKALAGGDDSVATWKNRKRIWQEMPAEAKQDATGQLPEKLGQKVDIHVKRRQNRAMITYFANLAREKKVDEIEALLRGAATQPATAKVPEPQPAPVPAPAPPVKEAAPLPPATDKIAESAKVNELKRQLDAALGTAEGLVKMIDEAKLKEQVDVFTLAVMAIYERTEKLPERSQIKVEHLISINDAIYQALSAESEIISVDYLGKNTALVKETETMMLRIQEDIENGHGVLDKKQSVRFVRLQDSLERCVNQLNPLITEMASHRKRLDAASTLWSHLQADLKSPQGTISDATMRKLEDFLRTKPGLKKSPPAPLPSPAPTVKEAAPLPPAPAAAPEPPPAPVPASEKPAEPGKFPDRLTILYKEILDLQLESTNLGTVGRDLTDLENEASNLPKNIRQGSVENPKQVKDELNRRADLLIEKLNQKLKEAKAIIDEGRRNEKKLDQETRTKLDDLDSYQDKLISAIQRLFRVKDLLSTL